MLVEPIPIPAPSNSKLVPTVDAIPTLKSASSIVVELTINSSPSTYKSPLILTTPLLSPTAAGSIISSVGPLIVFDVILMAEPISPVENRVAVAIPTTYKFSSTNKSFVDVIPKVVIPETSKLASTNKSLVEVIPKVVIPETFKLASTNKSLVEVIPKVLTPVTEKVETIPTLRVVIPAALIFTTFKFIISSLSENNVPPTYKSPPVVVIPPLEPKIAATDVVPKPITFNCSFAVIAPINA